MSAVDAIERVDGWEIREDKYETAAALTRANNARTPRPAWGDYRQGENREQARSFVAWRAAMRQPVFAESAALQLETWVATDSQDALSEMILDCRRPLDLNGYASTFAMNIWSLDRLIVDNAPSVRPGRRMPSLKKIAEHHRLGPVPECVRCADCPPVDSWRQANAWLARAHIIDRCMDGLDTCANLAPLCSPCHRGQPIFRSGDETAALRWFHLAEAATS